MPDDWKDPEFTRKWDRENLRGNPTRPEQLDVLMTLLEDEYREGQTVLGVGIGSGRVAEMILRRIPGARVVGVDGSPAMLAMARERLAEFGGRVEFVEHDLTEIDTLTLPARDYRFAVSVQTLHNIPPEANRRVLRYLSHRLPDGGLFLTLERIAIDTPRLYGLYRSLWRRLEREHGAAIPRGETLEAERDRLAAAGDRPLTLDQHLLWLRELGFEAACLHLHGNRALFAARRVL
jgi:ubiquinone/menaquinone biosynthesis C-methylase UbiE